MSTKTAVQAILHGVGHANFSDAANVNSFDTLGLNRSLLKLTETGIGKDELELAQTKASIVRSIEFLNSTVFAPISCKSELATASLYTALVSRCSPYRMASDSRDLETLVKRVREIDDPIARAQFSAMILAYIERRIEKSTSVGPNDRISQYLSLVQFVKNFQSEPREYNRQKREWKIHPGFTRYQDLIAGWDASVSQYVPSAHAQLIKAYVAEALRGLAPSSVDVAAQVKLPVDHAEQLLSEASPWESLSASTPQNCFQLHECIFQMQGLEHRSQALNRGATYADLLDAAGFYLEAAGSEGGVLTQGQIKALVEQGRPFFPLNVTVRGMGKRFFDLADATGFIPIPTTQPLTISAINRSLFAAAGYIWIVKKGNLVSFDKGSKIGSERTARHDEAHLEGIARDNQEDCGLIDPKLLNTRFYGPLFSRIAWSQIASPLYHRILDRVELPTLIDALESFWFSGAHEVGEIFGYMGPLLEPGSQNSYTFQDLVDRIANPLDFALGLESELSKLSRNKIELWLSDAVTHINEVLKG